MTSRVEIDVNETGAGTITVDGADLSKVVSGFMLTADANTDEPTRLLLHFPAVDATKVLADTKVEVDSPTYGALIALGWTPPA